MKYKRMTKKFKIGDIIEIPDNAVAIVNNGWVHYLDEYVDVKLLGIFPYKAIKTIWAYSFEWLEPVKEDNYERKA